MDTADKLELQVYLGPQACREIPDRQEQLVYKVYKEFKVRLDKVDP
jgi:hypothetical protein